MRIGIVRTNLAGTGGAERYAHGLIAELAAQGHEVHVFTTSLPAEYSVAVTPHFFTGETRAGAPFREWLQAETARLKLDVLFTMERTWPSDVFRAGDGVHRQWFEICRRNARGVARLWLPLRPFHRRTLEAETQLFRPENTRLVVCNSAMVSDEIAHYYAYPRERIRVVPNGTDFEQFRPAAPELRRQLRAQRGIAEDDTAALFTGSGFWRKGLDIAIELFAEWQRRQPSRRLQLFVVGKGKTAEYSRQVQKLGVARNVHFAGPQPPDKVLQWYQSADVFLFPTRYDPFANVCLEANACGVPVVTTTTNGFHEQIQTGVNGVVLQNDWDAARAAEATEELCRRQLAPETVRGAVAHLTTQAHVAALLALLQERVP